MPRNRAETDTLEAVGRQRVRPLMERFGRGDQSLQDFAVRCWLAGMVEAMASLAVTHPGLYSGLEEALKDNGAGG